MRKQPKPYLEKLRLRNKPYGLERRENVVKETMYNGTPMPKPVGYKDIDDEFKRWVENDLDVSFEGKRLPTMTLLSGQRFTEYAQSWQYVDEDGNLLLNFKTISRENNPQTGTIHNGLWNIPTDKKYPFMYVPVLQDNGLEAYDVYKMSQPFSIDLVYSVTIITNKYELLNVFNELVQNKFKSRQAYIKPNTYYMPMNLDNVSDESEYSLDNRKYYSQTFQIKVMAYIIREEDFEVEHLPSRQIISFEGDSSNRRAIIKMEEEINPCQNPPDEERYFNKQVTIIIEFPICSEYAKFKVDSDITITSHKKDNIYCMNLKINDELIGNLDNFTIHSGDYVKVRMKRTSYDKEAKLTLYGYDENVIYDSDSCFTESELDNTCEDEIIVVEP